MVKGRFPATATIRKPRSEWTHEDWQQYFQELETRAADRRAADPEEHEREKQRRRAERRAFWDRYQDENAHLNADRDLKGEMPHDQRERLRAIWHWVVIIEEGERVERIHLSQEARIANIKNRERCEGRVRSIGRAARAAGF